MTRLSFALTDQVNQEELDLAIDEALELIESPRPPTRRPSADDHFRFAHEAWMLLSLAMPAVAVQFSVLFIFPQTASTVGRNLGTEELAGFSLASLTSNLTILSVMVGALTAADTLMPRAFGTHHYPEVGRLAIRSLVMCSLLLIPPIIPLYTMMDWIFDQLGQDPVASKLASQWIKVYLLGVPAILLFRVAQSFLNAQHVVLPLVTASVVSCFVVHPIVLRLVVTAFGFLGSGMAVTITQTIMAILVYIMVLVRPKHHPETWPWPITAAFVKESFSPRPMLIFLKLSLGGVLSLSEWWFWEVTCFIVGSFGIVPLCVHTIAYNLVPLLFMIPLGMAIGLTVRMGTVLATSVKRAKLLAIYCMGFTTLIGFVVSVGLYILREPIVLLFSTDKKVMEGCTLIWPYLCAHIFLLHIFGINSAILRALAMQWHMAAIIFGTLWCGALPLTVYFGIFRGGGLLAIWRILPTLYGLMQVFLILSYTTVSWKDIAEAIREEHFRKSSLLVLEQESEVIQKQLNGNGVRAKEETPLL